jgi:hypothetical protein
MPPAERTPKDQVKEPVHMAIETVKIGGLSVTKVIIGGNPFSGFSHQGAKRDLEMKHYYTVARIKETLRQAEQLGVNTHISRSDHFVMRYLMEHWDEGGKVQWIAQTCPELGTIQRGVENAIAGGAKACFVHGGVTDFLFANNKLEEIPAAIAKIRAAGMPAGIAGHNPKVFEWAEENLDVDFYMCSYYNSAHRDKQAEHVSGMPEWFKAEDRMTMGELIQRLRRPVIHYKVLAAGRNDPAEALEFVARHLRPQDAVCVGVFAKDHPNALEEDIRLLREGLRRRKPPKAAQ